MISNDSGKTWYQKTDDNYPKLVDIIVTNKGDGTFDPKTIISNGLDKNNNTSSPKGLTLLEVLITLAILSIIIISFTTLFTNTNLTINYLGKKTIAVMEGKSILDKISLEAKTFEKIDEDMVKENISEILD